MPFCPVGPHPAHLSVPAQDTERQPPPVKAFVFPGSVDPLPGRPETVIGLFLSIAETV